MLLTSIAAAPSFPYCASNAAMSTPAEAFCACAACATLLEYSTNDVCPPAVLSNLSARLLVASKHCCVCIVRMWALIAGSSKAVLALQLPTSTCLSACCDFLVLQVLLEAVCCSVPFCNVLHWDAGVRADAVLDNARSLTARQYLVPTVQVSAFHCIQAGSNQQQPWYKSRHVYMW